LLYQATINGKKLSPRFQRNTANGRTNRIVRPGWDVTGSGHLAGAVHAANRRWDHHCDLVVRPDVSDRG
jgi:hypothetical protein